MFFYLLQAAIPDQAWEITPYNSVGYAAVVIILGIMAWKFYMDKEKAVEKRFEVIEKTTTLLTLVEQKLKGFEELKSMMRTNRELIEKSMRDSESQMDDIGRKIDYDN